MKQLPARLSLFKRINEALDKANVEGDFKVTKSPKVTIIRIAPKRATGIPTIVIQKKVDNMIVYLLDRFDVKTVGIMSIRNADDAKKFVKWYMLMLDLAAFRRDPAGI